MDETRETIDEYTAPKITDHGDLQELTAKGGGTFSDVSIGVPLGANPGNSNP